MSVPAKKYGGEQTWRIGRRMSLRRDALGLHQEDLAERLRVLGMDVTDGTISNMEKGSGLSAAKLPILAVALECTTTYLLDLTDSPTKWTPDRGLEKLVVSRVKREGQRRTLHAVGRNDQLLPSGAIQARLDVD